MKTDIKGASKTRPAAKKALPSAPQPKSARERVPSEGRGSVKTLPVPQDLQDRLREIGRAINTPAEEVTSMILHAGAEAMAAAITRVGKIQLPLEFMAPDPGRKAVLIREDDFRQVVRAGELVGLEDPANTFAADIITNIVDDPGNLLEVVGAIAANYRSAKEGGEA